MITDAFLLASAANDRQVKAIVDEIEDKLREIGAKPVRREGERDGRWVLIDYAEIVVHVQHEEERQFYALERLWRDCPSIPLPGRRRPSARRRLTGAPARPPPPRPDRLEPRRARQGHADVELDDVGRAQAERRRRGAGQARGPTLLWSSDLARARETAAYVADGDRPGARSTPGCASSTSASGRG